MCASSSCFHSAFALFISPQAVNARALRGVRTTVSPSFSSSALYSCAPIWASMMSPLPAALRSSGSYCRRIAPVDGMHLLFTIWAATQTYADFDVQNCAVMDQDALGEKDCERATKHAVSSFLRGCGL